MRLPAGGVIIRTCHISIHPKPGLISTNYSLHTHLQLHTLLHKLLIDTPRSSVCAMSQSDTITQTLQLQSCSFITLIHKNTHTHKYCDNDKCRFANKEEIKIPPHQHNVSQMFNARGERYRSDLSCSHTHTQFALVSQPSLHGNLRACSPWGELWWGYEIQRPSRTRERDRDRERTMRLPQRSQNNSRINRAGGMMPHLHTNTHLLTQTHIYTHKQTWRKMFPCMHFVTQFNNT